jgi:hypothetical protein
MSVVSRASEPLYGEIIISPKDAPMAGGWPLTLRPQVLRRGVTKYPSSNSDIHAQTRVGELEEQDAVGDIAIFVDQRVVVAKVYKRQIYVSKWLDDETLGLDHVATLVVVEQLIVPNAPLEGHGACICGARRTAISSSAFSSQEEMISTYSGWPRPTPLEFF